MKHERSGKPIKIVWSDLLSDRLIGKAGQERRNLSAGVMYLVTIQCAREPLNEHDRYSVAVKKDGIIIGHLPRKVSRLFSLFLRRGGCISCTVTGRRQYSADLPQGGLEVLCILLFRASSKEMKKLKTFLCK